MSSERSMENALQEEVFHHTRLLRSEASMVQNKYNSLLKREKPTQSERIQLYELASTTEGLHKSALDLYEEVNELAETIENYEVVGELLDQDFEDTYDAMDYLEDTQPFGNPLDAVFVEPLETINEEYSSLKMKIVSGPLYRDIEQEVEENETNKRRRELQADANIATENLAFSDSKLQELVNRSDDSNIEATKEYLEEQVPRTVHHFQYAVGTRGDIHIYRKQNNLLEDNYYPNTVFEPKKNSRSPDSTVEKAEDIDTERLDETIEEATHTLVQLDRLPFEKSPLEIFDDSEKLCWRGEIVPDQQK